MTKKELRKLFLEKRKSLNKASQASMNLALSANFFAAIDLSSTSVLHTYLPITDNNEPDTWIIVDRIRREFPRVQVCIPRMADSDTLDNILYEGPQQVASGKWGIPEPKYGNVVENEKLDLVIVPLLAVDRTGHRVGYGRGFYDRLLNDVRADCRKVGLSFFEPVNAIEDIGEHDVVLDVCVTPGGIVNFNQRVV